jgi:Kef-type K+ transport system membrane component KefB
MSSRAALVILTCIFLPADAAAASTAAGHSDPVVPILLALIVILGTAKLGSEVFERLGQPAVLGELLGGVLLGNLILLDPSLDYFEPLRVSIIREHWAVVIDSLARLGIILLLFEVGLENTVASMRKVGASSLLVALLGVIAPFLLGWGVSWLFIRKLPPALVEIVPEGFSLHYVHMFIGAVLCATSVGITARVFKDLGRLRSKEAQIILGAAVIDDVLGLVILAVISGIITAAEAGESLEAGSLLVLIASALLFLGASLAAGVLVVPRILKQLAKLQTAGIMLISSLLFAFALSYLASVAGLATIVGAFAAGLILEDVHFRAFREDISLEKILRPITTFFVPIFFVLMGIQVRLETFTQLPVLGLAAGITVAAIIGKQVCTLGVLEKGVHRIAVGIGMIPRGEVGLIFASIGKSLNVIDEALFSAIVIMVMVTTLITPPALKIALAGTVRSESTGSRATD